MRLLVLFSVKLVVICKAIWRKESLCLLLVRLCRRGSSLRELQVFSLLNRNFSRIELDRVFAICRAAQLLLSLLALLCIQKFEFASDAIQIYFLSHQAF